jgi:hypothetical protein
MIRGLIRRHMSLMCPAREARDAGQDLVGGLGPDKGLRIPVAIGDVA